MPLSKPTPPPWAGQIEPEVDFSDQLKKLAESQLKKLAESQRVRKVEPVPEPPPAPKSTGADESETREYVLTADEVRRALLDYLSYTHKFNFQGKVGATFRADESEFKVSLTGEFRELDPKWTYQR